MTSITLFRRHNSMTQPTTSLTKFKDCLRVPPTLHPQQMDDQRYSLRVQMRPAQIQLHSDLPPSEVWTYEGSLPGPNIEVWRGQHVQIEWINALPARSEEHTSELQSHSDLVCRLLLEKKKTQRTR